jgi:hypothetical protein
MKMAPRLYSCCEEPESIGPGRSLGNLEKGVHEIRAAKSKTT